MTSVLFDPGSRMELPDGATGVGTHRLGRLGGLKLSTSQLRVQLKNQNHLLLRLILPSTLFCSRLIYNVLCFVKKPGLSSFSVVYIQLLFDIRRRIIFVSGFKVLMNLLQFCTNYILYRFSLQICYDTYLDAKKTSSLLLNFLF